MKPTPQLPILAVLALAVSPASGAFVFDTFTNEAALQWSTTGGTLAASKTVHFVGSNTGVGFDVTLATNTGNLVTGAYQPSPGGYLADSSGTNGSDWFEGTMTVMISNFTGAAPGDISFQLVDFSGLPLVSDGINFASTATAATVLPFANSNAFSNFALDSAAANMGGGSYAATIHWKNATFDPETSGLFRAFSFQVGTNVPEPGSLGLLCLGGLLLMRRGRR
jgi:hypothetical protein